MGEFHHHKPSGFIRVSDDAGQTWVGPEAEFVLDFNASIPALDQGITERVYITGKRHALITGADVASGGQLTWPIGEALIATVGAAIAARSAREATAQQKARRTPIQELSILRLLTNMNGVAPVRGVFTPDVTDKSTWQVVFADEATQEQRDAAQAIFASFDLATAEQQEQTFQTRLTTFAGDAGVTDLLARIRSATVAEIDTWLTNNVTNLVQARTVLAAIIKLLAVKLR